MDKNLKIADFDVFNIIEKEETRQHNELVLIPSENSVSLAVMQAVGSVLTNKYAEGYPNARYYTGCENVDSVESLAIERLKKLFGCEHANVQPHSGANANLAVYFAVLKPGDTILGMNLTCGGHLTHGSKVAVSGKWFSSVAYGVDAQGLINYAEIEELAKIHKPKIIVCGGSAYPRKIDFKRINEIAKGCGAYLLADIAHIAGLVVAGLHENPVPYADFVTSTTHKTLRGPRGGIIMCKEKFAKIIDKAVFPGTQGGPLMHVIAGKAVAFKEALLPEFKTYQQQVVANAKTLEIELKKHGIKLISDGTDTHLLLLDLSSTNSTGDEIAKLLKAANISANKNTIPYDTKSPTVTSGIRIGTPAITTRGMKEKQMKIIAELISNIIKEKQSAVESVKKQVAELCMKTTF